MAISQETFHLVLFFTYRMSLADWYNIGSFEREVAIYRRLQQLGHRVSFVTYGDSRDLAYTKDLPGIDILCNRWKLPIGLYKRLVPIQYARYLSQCTAIKTNQLNGGDVAALAAQIWRKPLIARCGYMWSQNTANQYGRDSIVAKRARRLEEYSWRHARKIVVTTHSMADAVLNRMPSVGSRISVVPNYVDTTLFLPGPGADKEFDIVFVGRISPEKNLEALLKAVQFLRLKLLVIGGGNDKNPLTTYLKSSPENIFWEERIPNVELPKYLNRARLFVLPSHYEGHPKTLIEAMACGLPILGSNVPGIREIIRHGENGWLCETDSESLAKAIQYLLDDPELCAKLGQNARQYALDHFSLGRVLELELNLLRETKT